MKDLSHFGLKFKNELNFKEFNLYIYDVNPDNIPLLKNILYKHYIILGDFSKTFEHHIINTFNNRNESILNEGEVNFFFLELRKQKLKSINKI